MNIASINIKTNSPNITSCTLKCDLAFDYGDISDLTITNIGDYLSLTSTATNKPVTYNLNTYKVAEIRIYRQSVNKFNDQTSNGEIVVIHKSDGKPDLYICVPIKNGNSSDIATGVLSTIISQAKTGANSTSNNSNKVVMQKEEFVYNLNDFIPRKPFYMAFVNNINYIIFPPSSNTYVYVNNSDFEILSTITTAKTYTPINPNPQISYNARGPSVAKSDEIYIDCQPVGESDNKKTVVTDNGKPALSAAFNLKTFFSNVFIQLILGSLVFVIFIMIVNKFLDAMSSKNTTEVLKTAVGKRFKNAYTPFT
jgi:hypothetical protein